MKLLVLTQKIDREDDVLGFFHEWVRALASKFTQVTVICLERGQADLPANVKVFSLGKEQAPNRLAYIIQFYKLLWRLEGEYEAVFVHMNQEYVLLGGWWWRLRGRTIGLWRNHPNGSGLTRLAVFLANKVFCTSPFSFTARYKKTTLMPVGINTDKFKPLNGEIREKNSLLFLSRIAPIKHPEILIEALGLLKAKGIMAKTYFYGAALPKDQAYFNQLKARVLELKIEDVVTFHPAIPNYEAPAIYNQHEIFINLTPSGSLDKTILEAAACGCLLVITNQSLAGEIDERLIATSEKVEDVAQRIEFILNLAAEEKKRLSLELETYVAQKHSLNSLVDKLAQEIL